jgi:hypothetical protein
MSLEDRDAGPRRFFLVLAFGRPKVLLKCDNSKYTVRVPFFCDQRVNASRLGSPVRLSNSIWSPGQLFLRHTLWSSRMACRGDDPSRLRTLLFRRSAALLAIARLGFWIAVAQFRRLRRRVTRV